MKSNPGLRHARMFGRAGFTSLELMVVLVIFAICASLAVPGLLGAMRRTRLSEAANAIMRCSSQARQLARSRFDTNALTGAGKFYGVVVVDTAIPAYAALTYGTNASVASILMVNGQPSFKQTFNKNIMVYLNNNPLNSQLGWMYQYRTAYPINTPSLVARPINIPDPPSPPGLELRTQDGNFRFGIAVYSVGLINIQEL